MTQVDREPLFHCLLGNCLPDLIKIGWTRRDAERRRAKQSKAEQSRERKAKGGRVRTGREVVFRG